MKLRKIISLFSAIAVSASMLTTVAFAATTPTANSNPEIVGVVESVDDDGNAMLKFTLKNNEALSYYDDFGYITSNGINAIQIKVTLDENVFDTSNLRVQKGLNGVNTAVDTSLVTFAFGPTSPDAYMYEVPEFLFKVRAPLKSGYTKDNIPNSAVTYGETIVEYKAYHNSDVVGNHTIYAVNAPTKHYDLTVGFTGTATDDDDDDDDDEVKEFDAIADEKQAVGNIYNGKYLKHIATVLEGADANKRISISDGTQTQVSGRTLAQVFGASLVTDAKINAKIAIGVLTDDPDATFAFSLVSDEE